MFDRSADSQFLKSMHIQAADFPATPKPSLPIRQKGLERLIDDLAPVEDEDDEIPPQIQYRLSQMLEEEEVARAMWQRRAELAMCMAWVLFALLAVTLLVLVVVLR